VKSKTTQKDRSAERPIGIFDSGIGGLTVVREINRLLPNEKVIYFGDTARVPYGNKSKETIIDYSLQIAYFLMRKKIKLLVAACNTVSSVSIPTLRRHLHIPIVGVIEPGAKCAANSSRNHVIGVIGTLATIASNSYRKAIKKFNSSARIFQKPCPLFVPLAEDGWHETRIAQSISDEYLGELRVKNIDTLILGCTHYPILKKVIKRTVGKKVELIDSGRETAREVKRLLEKYRLLNDNDISGKDNSIYYVSDFPYKFKEVSERFLARKLEKVHKVKL
jgi:glutamate racemase